MADGFTFDPDRDGFGFRNPTGGASDRTGGGRPIRRSDAFVYGKGLCFGSAPNRRFLHCLARAHATVPYWVEEERVYVYDPNHPQDRDRFVKFTHGEFEYGGFRSREGWGITLVPSHALSVKRVTPVRPNRDWPIATYP